ncbi:DNA polymerase IV [Rhodococcus sp. AG1013]|uniref:DNA polymerase IV n=1 Tax=unclassified Rhodococcus (in: high G+C Gram-positive bacteria) TaxID=192944 RepID=UPI000E0C4E6E|nr:DNA polymerase IV [Rhodococcus sp. AG1013]RDI32628.1 DNA polymerase-4 [Rhodococcus sp. AG1013]
MDSADPTRSRRWVLHLDMDAFFASVEQLTRPTLRGRPVLVGGLGGRGVVAGASYEARVFGARSAMPMHQARRLVGASAVVLPPRGGLYGHVSREVFEALRVRMPVLEQLSLDEAFGEPAELAGAGKAEVERYCEELRALVLAETGLVASIGAGAGKQVAKIASGLAKPDGITVVSPDVQQALLEALPVRKLWGIGPVAEEKLKRLGIETVGALAALPEAEVASILGTTIGPSLQRLARGIDDRPVAERADAKQVSAETTFAQDIVTLSELRRAVESSAAAAHRRLARDGRAARTVVLKLRKSDMSIVTRSITLPYATTDLQTLTATAQRQAIDPLELGPIRLVGVGFGGLSAVVQGSLFPELDQGEDVSESGGLEDVSSDRAASESRPRWHPGLDVSHPEYGHGWVQGAGHGVVTVRFETRSSGPGQSRTFEDTTGDLDVADPLDSLG